MARVLRSIGALGVLAAILIGAPWLLWQVGQEILPDRMPSLAEIWDTLTSRDTGTTFIGLLVIVGLIAWAIFTVCVILDIAARIGGRTTPWRVPGLRLPQRLASGLVSAVIAGIVTIGGHTPASAADTPPPVSASASVSVQAAELSTQHLAPSPAGKVGQKTVTPAVGPAMRPAAPAQARHPAAGQRAAAPTVTVQPGDSLWKLAAKHLGDPLRYKEIADLNLGRTQPGGAALTSPDQWLEVGWVLTLPSDAHGLDPAPTAHPGSADGSSKVVIVQAGDTLSAIAERELGAADRYPELAQLNHLDDPDELAIGQTLEVPDPDQQVQAEQLAAERAKAHEAAEQQQRARAKAAAAAAAAEKASAAEVATQKAAAEKAAAEKAEREHSSPAEQQPLHELGASPAEQPPSQPPVSEVAAASPPAASSPPTTNTSAVGQNPPASAAPDTAGAADVAIRAVGIGAVAASVLWGALLLRRRRQGTRRKLGEQPAPASLPAARVEREIRQQASGVDIGRLEQTLRTLSMLTVDDHEFPDLTCAWLAPDGLRLRLAAEMAPPAALPVEVTGLDWWLPADAKLPELAWTEAVAPFPALASLGAANGEGFLVDLEQLGAIRVAGDPLRVQHLYNHLTVELAHSTWSDGLNIVLVGWGADLVVLAPDRVGHEPELGGVLTRLRHRVARTRESEQSLETSVLGGRMGDVAGDIWSPQVLLIAPTAARDQQQLADLDELLTEVAGHGRAAIAVVAAVDDNDLQSSTDLYLDAAGWLTCPTLLGEQQIRAAGVDEDLLQRLVELIVATEVQQPAPPATDPEPWATGMATSGALLEDTPAAPALDRTGEEAGAGAAEDDAPVDPTHEDQRDPGGSVVPLRPVPPQAAAVLDAVLSNDPTLDEDLAEWRSEVITRPKIGIIGPATVTSAGKSGGRLVRCAEIAVYLALHRSVTTDKFVTDLWAEDQQPSAATRRWWLSTVRTWLGVDDQERPYLAQANRGVQELTDRLLDVELLRRLRKRGEAWAAAGDAPRAYRDFQDAMRLVRGPILHQAPPGSYAFLSNPDRGEDHLLPLWVVQVARQTVDLGLQLGDLDGARDAAEKAHLVAPDEDAPLTDLVRIAQTAGRQFEAREWATKILREHYRAQYIEDIENTETMLELSRLFPDGLQAG